MANEPQSAIIDHQPIPVTISAGPGTITMTIPCWADPRGAPSPQAAIVSTLARGMVYAHEAIAQLSQQLALVQVALIESLRANAADSSEAAARPTEALDVPRDPERYALALDAVAQMAKPIKLTAEREPASALDAVRLD